MLIEDQIAHSSSRTAKRPLNPCADRYRRRNPHQKLSGRLAEKNIDLTLPDNVRLFIAATGYRPVQGTRPRKHITQPSIEHPVSLQSLPKAKKNGWAASRRG
ncbi:MAG: hypothetical protein JSW39_00660 [Desulfobacterales bacterium]|nr:MAG: hypothetical protein JSW39_00660 [Desulfobacterales bacterium]